MEGIIAKGQLVPLVFSQAALAASQTNVQLKAIETPAASGALAVDGITMPFKGAIVGFSGDTSAAATAGSLAAGVTIGGTEEADTTQTITTEVAFRARFQREAIRFAAGDKIGVEITTDGDWDATTADLLVIVWVLLDLEGI